MLSVETNGYFGEIHRLYLQVSVCYLFHAGFLIELFLDLEKEGYLFIPDMLHAASLLSLFFDPEDEGDIFLRKLLPISC
jgi:hypothetical protein